MKRDLNIDDDMPSSASSTRHRTEVEVLQPIGEIIRSVRTLSDTDVEHILTVQNDRGLRFGEAAVALSLVSQADVLWALAQQFDYPYTQDDAGPSHPDLILASDPYCPQAEAIRDLRSQLMEQLGRSGHPIAVVSPDAGDGRTFLAANLAVAFSQLGERTILIDANLRQPRLHTLFGLPEQEGLSAILAGRRAVQPRPVPGQPNLIVLQVGTPPPNPLELLQRPPLARVLAELSRGFDRVIVDTPAAGLCADARVIAATCGCAVLVGRKHHSSQADLKRMVAGLRRTKVEVAGVVIHNH